MSAPVRRICGALVLAALALAAGCGPIGLVGDAAVGATQVAVGAADLII